MTYTLRAHVREAEPYTGLYDYDDIRNAVEQEVETTINDLGSDYLNDGTEHERELAAELLTDEAMTHLWGAGGPRTEFRLPGRIVDYETGRRSPGVLLSLEVEQEAAA